MQDKEAPDHLEVWRRDSETLRELVQRWLDSSDLVEVMIPRALAEAAVESWERFEPTGDPDERSTEEPDVRTAAALIGLIGNAVSSRGEWSEGHVSVGLPLSVLCEAAALPRDLIVS